MNSILEVCLSPAYGGLELHTQDFAKSLGLFIVVRKGSQLHEGCQKEGILHQAIGRFDVLKLARIIDEKAIDVLHIQWTKDLPIAVLAKKLSKRKPKIVQTRNMNMTRFKSDFYHRFLYKNIDLMAAISQQVNQQLHRFIPEDIRPKIITWYSGVRPPKMLSEQEKQQLKAKLQLTDEFIVCCVARIEHQKGQHIVLEAVQKLRDQGINAKAIIVGPAMNEDYLAQLKARYTQDIFTGFSTIANEYIQIADCKVMATENETFGMAIMDAMRCGTCVLGSDSGGFLESIEHGETGLHFKTMNSQDLYEKLHQLYLDPSLKQHLASAGKAKADQNYDSLTQFNCLLKIMQEL